MIVAESHATGTSVTRNPLNGLSGLPLGFALIAAFRGNSVPGVVRQLVARLPFGTAVPFVEHDLAVPQMDQFGFAHGSVRGKDGMAKRAPDDIMPHGHLDDPRNTRRPRRQIVQRLCKASL